MTFHGPVAVAVAVTRVDSGYETESQNQQQQNQQQRKKPSAWWTTHRHHGPSDIDFHNPYAYPPLDSDSDSEFDDDDPKKKKKKVTLKAWQLPDRGAITIILTDKEPLTSPRTPPPVPPYPPPPYPRQQYPQHPLRQHPNHHYVGEDDRAIQREQEEGDEVVVVVGQNYEEEDEDEKNDKHTVIPMYFARSFTGRSRALAMRQALEPPPPVPVIALDSKAGVVVESTHVVYPDKETAGAEYAKDMDLEAQDHHSAECGVGKTHGQGQKGEEELFEEYTGGTWAVVLVAVLCGGMVLGLIVWQALKYKTAS